jgi:UDP-2,3-diacylglucosamine pyrophosphatase LpxH
MTETIRGVFVSDLHLFARRSRADQLRDELRFAAAQSPVFILGGDIFDFKWSQLGSFEATVDAALDWLRELTLPFPTCQFHYLLGNHDDHPRFVEKAMQLCDEVPHLTLHPHRLRLGSHVFLHGHVLDGYEINHELLQCQNKSESLRHGSSHPHARLRTPTPVAHAAYEVLVRARLHRMLVTIVHRRKQTAERLVNYLESEGLSANTGVTDVLFGHTHRAMASFAHRGLRFHNGGAAIVGLPFRIVPWEASLSAGLPLHIRGRHETQNDG